MAAISLENTTRYAQRYHTQRINRRLDDRDGVLKEAFAIMEEKSASYYPKVTIIPVIDCTGHAGGFSTANYDQELIVVINGVNFVADDTKYSATIGGKACTISSSSTTAVTVTMPAESFSSGERAAGDTIFLKLNLTMSSASGGTSPENSVEVIEWPITVKS